MLASQYYSKCVNDKKYVLVDLIHFHYYFRSKLITGLLSAKSDRVRKGKIEKDIKKVDVRNLEIRAIKPAHNSHREVLSARRSIKRNNPIPAQRSRSASRMETDEDVFNEYT